MLRNKGTRTDEMERIKMLKNRGLKENERNERKKDTFGSNESR
jgi:hypothetical protein